MINYDIPVINKPIPGIIKIFISSKSRHRWAPFDIRGNYTNTLIPSVTILAIQYL